MRCHLDTLESLKNYLLFTVIDCYEIKMVYQAKLSTCVQGCEY